MRGLTPNCASIWSEHLVRVRVGVRVRVRVRVRVIRVRVSLARAPVAARRQRAVRRA